MSRDCFLIDNVARARGQQWGEYWANTTSTPKAGGQMLSLVHALTGRLVNDPLIERGKKSLMQETPVYVLVVDAEHAVEINVRFIARRKKSLLSEDVSGTATPNSPDMEADELEDSFSPATPRNNNNNNLPRGRQEPMQRSPRRRSKVKSAKGLLRISVRVPPLHFELDRAQLSAMLALASALSTFKVYARYRKFKQRWIRHQDLRRQHHVQQLQRLRKMRRQRRAFEGALTRDREASVGGIGGTTTTNDERGQTSQQAFASTDNNNTGAQTSAAAGDVATGLEANIATGSINTEPSAADEPFLLGRPTDPVSCQRWWKYIISCILEVNVREDLRRRSWLRLLKLLAQRNACVRLSAVRE